MCGDKIFLYKKGDMLMEFWDKVKNFFHSFELKTTEDNKNQTNEKTNLNENRTNKDNEKYDYTYDNRESDYVMTFNSSSAFGDKETTKKESNQQESKQENSMQMYKVMYKDGKKYRVALKDVEKALKAGYEQNEETEESIISIDSNLVKDNEMAFEKELEQEAKKQDNKNAQMYRVMYKDGKKYIVQSKDIEKALEAGFVQNEELEEDIISM